MLTIIDLDSVRQVNITKTDTDDGVTMFTSATHLNNLPGESIVSDETDIFDRNASFVPEEQAGLDDLQNIQKPVGVETLGHVVNYTVKDGQNNVLFVADHKQVQEVENAVRKIQGRRYQHAASHRHPVRKKLR